LAQELVTNFALVVEFCHHADLRQDSHWEDHHP
jgi:hypothetical protein